MPMGSPRGGDVASLGVRGEIEDVSVSARAQNDHVGEVCADLAGRHAAGDDAACAPVVNDQVEHLGSGVHLHGAGFDLPAQRLVGPEKELLPRLAPRVEGS